jgi:hypothetical protein
MVTDKKNFVCFMGELPEEEYLELWQVYADMYLNPAKFKPGPVPSFELFLGVLAFTGLKKMSEPIPKN